MGIKEKLEGHALTVVAAVAVAGGSIVFGVTAYFHRQDLKQAKAKYEQASTQMESDFRQRERQMQSKLSSIQLGLGDDKFYDVRRLMHFRGATLDISDDAKYIAVDGQEKGGFYAPMGSPYWKTYEKTTELELIKKSLGEDASQSLKGTPLGRFLQKLPAHLWTADGSYSIKMEGVAFTVLPHILVQTFDRDTLADAVGTVAWLYASPKKDDKLEFGEEDLSPDKDAEQLIETLGRAFYDDMVGTYWLIRIFGNLQGTLSSPNQSFRLIRVQRVANVLYSESVTDLRNVIVNGESGKSYHVWQAMILISARPRVYIVTVTIPSLKPELPRDQRAHMLAWLGSFRAVVD